MEHQQEFLVLKINIRIMKKYILFGFFIIIFASLNPFLAKSQAPVYDNLYLNQFDITTPTATFSSVNTLLLGQAAFLQKFGTPTSTTSVFSETEDGYITHFVYNGLEVTYFGDDLKSLVITNTNYCFKWYNGFNLIVGDYARDLESGFGNSITNQFPGDNRIYATLLDQTGPVDGVLLFTYAYNGVDDVITSISFQD